MSCISFITGGFAVCPEAPSGKVKDRMVLINVNDVDFANVTIKNELNGEPMAVVAITNLALKPGKKGYLVSGINGSIIFRESASRGTYWAPITQEVEFIAWDISPKALSTAKRLMTSRLLAVFETNGHFRVAGWRTGLQLREANADTSDAEKGGLFTFILDMEQASSWAPLFGNFTGTAPEESYDYAASLQAFEALYEPIT